MDRWKSRGYKLASRFDQYPRLPVNEQATQEERRLAACCIFESVFLCIARTCFVFQGNNTNITIYATGRETATEGQMVQRKCACDIFWFQNSGTESRITFPKYMFLFCKTHIVRCIGSGAATDRYIQH